VLDRGYISFVDCNTSAVSNSGPPSSTSIATTTGWFGSEHELADVLRAFAAAGTDEVHLIPTSSDVHRLASRRRWCQRRSIATLSDVKKPPPATSGPH
jgi:hypothetical protein